MATHGSRQSAGMGPHSCGVLDSFPAELAQLLQGPGTERREHPRGARPAFKADGVREAKLRHQRRSTCTTQPAPAADHSLHTAPSGEGGHHWSLLLRHFPASPKYLPQTSLEGERGVCSLPKTTMKSSLLKWLLLLQHPSHKQGTCRG